ncbi:ABC transporter ATP-binding protein [Terasakiella pusilla]|uniref:ABC transporter ATP-binding protein n=1 Tax=Terasakiella pusilla TaxID=64973 RepID=UPI003AA7B811
MTGQDTTHGPVLCLSGVRRIRGQGENRFVLDVRNLRVPQSQAICVTGPSGCGKSTLLDLIGLVLKPDQGAEFVFTSNDGRKIDLQAAWNNRQEADLSAIRAQYLGYILQTGGIFPFLSVDENIRVSQRLLGQGNEEVVQHLIERLNISHLLKKKPKALSIGERQRVCIARALAHQPSLILADEPTASLDRKNADRVMDLFMTLVQDFGTSAIIVSHEKGLARHFGLREVPIEVKSLKSGKGTVSVLEMSDG